MGGLTGSEWDEVYRAEAGNVVPINPWVIKRVLQRAMRLSGTFEPACKKLGLGVEEAMEGYILADSIEKYGPDTDKWPISVFGSTAKPALLAGESGILRWNPETGGPPPVAAVSPESEARRDREAQERAAREAAEALSLIV